MTDELDTDEWITALAREMRQENPVLVATYERLGVFASADEVNRRLLLAASTVAMAMATVSPFAGCSALSGSAHGNGVGMIESRPRFPVGSRIGRSTGVTAGVVATVFDTLVAIDAAGPSLEFRLAGRVDGQRLIPAREPTRGR